jgi:hypothetical protein
MATKNRIKRVNKKSKINVNKKKNKKKYKVRNWHDYNESLKQRGALDVWIEESVIENWYAEPNGKQGAQPIYTDLAIQITLQFGKVFGQRLRQNVGLVNSVFRLMKIDLDVPDFSTLSRRGETIKVKLPKDNKVRVILIEDSSGLKVYGEGEWKVRKHGWSKHRAWRKMHLIITPDGEIREAELTENNVSDDKVAAELLDQEEAEIESFAGDGAFDTRKIYDKCLEKGIKNILIPPQKNAKIWQRGNCNAPPHPRDENLRQIRKTSRRKWKEDVGYHIRSLSETAMFRFKTIFGDRLDARNFNQQRNEFLIKASILNKMMKLGMPDSYAVG